MRHSTFHPQQMKQATILLQLRWMQQHQRLPLTFMQGLGREGCADADARRAETPMGMPPGPLICLLLRLLYVMETLLAVSFIYLEGLPPLWRTLEAVPVFGGSCSKVKNSSRGREKRVVPVRLVMYLLFHRYCWLV